MQFCLSLVLCFVAFALSAQDPNGIGIRLGEPAGLSFKRFWPDDNALEVILGTARPGWSYNYYANSFNDYTAYKDFRYRSHQVKSTLYLQSRYVLHYEIYIQGLGGKLDWYWGPGLVFKTARVEYRYQQKEPPLQELREVRVDIDLGPEAIIGMEYRFPTVPFAAYGEISVMGELLDRPLTMRLFSGAGIRYQFGGRVQ